MERSLFLLCHVLAVVGVDAVNGWRMSNVVGCNDAKKRRSGWIAVSTARMRSLTTIAAASCVTSLPPDRRKCSATKRGCVAYHTHQAAGFHEGKGVWVAPTVGSGALQSVDSLRGMPADGKIRLGWEWGWGQHFWSHL